MQRKLKKLGSGKSLMLRERATKSKAEYFDCKLNTTEQLWLPTIKPKQSGAPDTYCALTDMWGDK